MEDLKKLLLSFKYAFSGIAGAIKTERNMRIHIVCMIYMYSFLGLTDWFVLSRTDWAVIFLANAIVIMGELVNTAVENAVDLETLEQNPLAKKAKDCAAGAVLVGAIFAVCVGLSVLLQKDAFVKLYEYFASHIIWLAVFVASLVPAALFMFRGIPSKNKQNGEKNENLR